VELTLLGIGAANSPRYRPAGLLISHADRQVMIDGGGTASPSDVRAWLVCDLRSELIADIRRRSREMGLRPEIAELDVDGLRVTPMPIVHTSHPTYGYLLRAAGARVVWSPEFWEFPDWAANADLMFADAAGWRRPIKFAGGVGGHAAALDTARQARERGVRRLVLAHVGRPSIRAIDAGEHLPYGEWGVEGNTYRL
jgi:ribonuclease BN (tRNA processing enzyme)